MSWNNPSDIRRSLKLVSGPSNEVLKKELVKEHLRVDTNDQDALIEAAIVAVREYLDGSAGILGRSLVKQTWDLVLECFPAHIRVPLPPLRSIDQITYVDDNGDTQTLASTEFEIVGLGSTQPAWIEPAFEKVWPSTRRVPEAVTVRFEAGYPSTTGSPASDVDNVPQPITQAMLLMIGDIYENRETVAVGASATEIPISTTVQRLLAPYVVAFFG